MAILLVRVGHVPVKLGGDAHSWVLTSKGTTVHNAEAVTRLKARLSEGDVVVKNTHTCMHTVAYTLTRLYPALAPPILTTFLLHCCLLWSAMPVFCAKMLNHHRVQPHNIVVQTSWKHFVHVQ